MTAAFELHSTGTAIVTVLPNRGDALTLQRNILGTAPEYLHSKRHGALYRPSYYHWTSKSVVTAKEPIQFTFQPNQPIAVASVLHHRDTRALHRNLAHVTEDVVVDFMRHHDPWFSGGAEIKARYLPGRFWRNVMRPEFQVRLKEEELRGDEIFVAMFLNLGRKSRFYRVIDPDNPPELIQIRPGQVLLCRQGTFVESFRPEGQQVDHLALELTAYWVAGSDATVLERLWDLSYLTHQEAPSHGAPLFIEEEGWKWHMTGPLYSSKATRWKLLPWTKSTFAPFMRTSFRDNFELRDCVGAALSVAAIRAATRFPVEFWERNYPAYSEEEHAVYEVRRYF